MAACSSSWNAAVLRWSRVAELGMEVALCEAGCPEQMVVATLSLFDHDDTRFDLGELEGMTDPELARATVLATLARGDSNNSLIGGPACWTATEAAALCVNLSSNSNVSHVTLHDIDVLGTIEGCAFVGNALATNSSLRELALIGVGMGSDGIRGLLHGLQSNKTLESLCLMHNPLLDEGLSFVAEFMITNSTIKELNLFQTGYSGEGTTQMSSILVKNSTLKTLYLGNEAIGREAMKRLLEPLSVDVRDDAGTSSSSSKNTSLKSLYLDDITPECVDCVSHMIRTNKSLSHVRLGYCLADPTDWKEKILPAIKKNETLVGLNFIGSRGLVGDEFYESLMDWLQNSNTHLEHLGLSGTRLDSRQGQINEELRINKQYRHRLRGQPQMTTTSGRVVLCGYAFAGKTEISKTMKRIEHGKPFTHSLKMVYKKLMQSNPTVQRTLLGRDAHKELTARTRGFQVVVLQNQGSLKSIWDFAGQKEYYALHDYVFPNVKNSYFLYVCSCRHPPDYSHRKGKEKDEPAIRRECEYWLRFLASNCKPVRSDESQLPRVRFVLTKTDTLHSSQKVISEAKNVVRDLKGMFKNVLNLWKDIEVINAHSARDVQRLLTASSTNLEEMLQREKEYNVCEDVRNVLAEWSRGNLLKPVLSLEEFYKLCEQKLDFNQLSEDGWKIVLSYLNDLGEIVFSKNTDFIVTNPSWFGIDVLGSLINACKGADSRQTNGSKWTNAFRSRVVLRELYHRKGFVERQDMIAHLECSLQSMHLKQSIPAEKLIDLMIQLEMCFPAHLNDAEGTESSTESLLFIPALFDDENETAAKGERKLEWAIIDTGPFEFLGRRLECRDRATTFLTPGFFPRLQVHLRNYIDSKGWTKNLGFGVGRNLIRFTNSGIEVCVEYAGDTDDFIDILVRSSISHKKAANFIEEHVVQTIRTFCASPQGCQGVNLVESVLRLVCVKYLHLCVNRKPHAVLVTQLRDAVAEDDAYKHTWSKRVEGVSDTDHALDLLEGEGSFERICGEGQVRLAPSTSNSTAIESSNTDGLPRLIYPTTQDVGIFRRLETNFNTKKLITIKLHVLCEHRDGPHKVAEQPGRTVRLDVTDDGYNVPVAKFAITLLWAGLGVGASVLGASSTVPQVDKFMERLFTVPEMPALDVKTIQRMMDPGRLPGRVPEQEILKVLERYWKADPHSQGLKEIFKLQEGNSFYKDFKLHKVKYTKGADAGETAWLCKKHFEEGFRQKILRSVPH